MKHGRGWGWPAIAALALSAVWLPSAVLAQSESLELKLRRTFGYAWGNEIQGSFLLTVQGPADLRQVTFHIDEGVLAQDGAAPFEARLHTGDYPLGTHRLWAEGERADGSPLASEVTQVEFVAASASWQGALRILGPVLAVAALALVGGVVLSLVSGRRYRPGAYGRAGGAVCPRCRLPMNRHVLSPNLGPGKKLERCPHCAAWSRVRRASMDELSAAEARLRGESAPEATGEDQAEALRRQVDDSRFVE
ncbi:MAG TPA: hypothetical protein VK449_00215 [Anaerolineales bacterium]|nr:hypothetical protein [Anaerolineales bacterium]